MSRYSTEERAKQSNFFGPTNLLTCAIQTTPKTKRGDSNEDIKKGEDEHENKEHHL